MNSALQTTLPFVCPAALKLVGHLIDSEQTA